MIPKHAKIPGRQHHIFTPGRGTAVPNLRHRAFIAFFLLSGALVFSIASFFTDGLFSVLNLLGVPSAQLCLTLAFVLGISGIVTSIVVMIERIDRFWSQAAMFQKSKEHSYANRN